MSEQHKIREELLQRIHENSQKLGLYRLESDENGNFLLDPSNRHHVAWLENDNEYEIIDEKKTSI